MVGKSSLLYKESTQKLPSCDVHKNSLDAKLKRRFVDANLRSVRGIFDINHSRLTCSLKVIGRESLLLAP